MFARSIIRRVSPFSLFKIRSKDDPALKACATVQKRGKLLAKMFRGLSQTERAEINLAARKIPGVKHARGRNPVCSDSSKVSEYKKWLAAYANKNKVTLGRAAKAYKAMKKGKSLKPKNKVPLVKASKAVKKGKSLKPKGKKFAAKAKAGKKVAKK
jgi:hypothetical protein